MYGIIYTAVLVILFFGSAVFLDAKKVDDGGPVAQMLVLAVFWPLTLPLGAIIFGSIMLYFFINDNTEKFRRRIYSKREKVKFE